MKKHFVVSAAKFWIEWGQNLFEPCIIFCIKHDSAIKFHIWHSFVESISFKVEALSKMVLNRKGTLVIIVDNNRFWTCQQWYVIKNAQERSLPRIVFYVFNLEFEIYITHSVFIVIFIPNSDRCRNNSVSNNQNRRLKTIDDFGFDALALDKPETERKCE